MGQRLIMTIHADGNDVCNCYYHWGAYTMSALETAKNFINNFNDQDNEKPIAHRIIDAFAKEGAYIEAEDVQFVKDTYQYEQGEVKLNRNDGIIAFSEKEMKNNESWSEGDLLIDLDAGTIAFDILNETDNLDYFNEEYERETPLTEENFKELSVDPTAFDISNLEKLISSFESGKYFSYNGQYYTLVE